MTISLLSTRLRGLLQREDHQGLVLLLAGASGLPLRARLGGRDLLPFVHGGLPAHHLSSTTHFPLFAQQR
jgi:hypothetical protein